MKMKLACTLLILIATAMPSFSHPGRRKHRHPRQNHNQPIREKKPSLVRLSLNGALPFTQLVVNPTVGLDYSYNLNRYFAIGAHADTLVGFSNLGLNLRTYLYKTSGAPYIELNGGASIGANGTFGASNSASANTYYVNALMGYEYRNQSGFTWGGGIGPGIRYEKFVVDGSLFLGWAF